MVLDILLLFLNFSLVIFFIHDARKSFKNNQLRMGRLSLAIACFNFISLLLRVIMIGR